MRSRLVPLVLVLLSAAIGLAPAAHAGPVPYTDGYSTGKITLCDTAGNVATGGKINVKPFAWRAVGQSIPQGYGSTGRTASLYGFIPFKDLDPSEWRGDYLTFAAKYTSASRPMAAATASDPTLADLLASYSTRWDGLVELRLFLGAPQQPVYTQKYDSATIRVTGDTWTLLDGGTGGCDTGEAVSGENNLPAVRKLGTPAANATTDSPATAVGGRTTGASKGSTPSPKGRTDRAPSSAAAGTGASSADSAASNPPSTTAANGAQPTASSASSGVSGWVWTLLGIAVIGGIGGAVWFRPRRPRDSS